jgi:hypothetical protein
MRRFPSNNSGAVELKRFFPIRFPSRQDIPDIQDSLNGNQMIGRQLLNASIAHLEVPLNSVLLRAALAVVLLSDK